MTERTTVNVNTSSHRHVLFVGTDRFLAKRLLPADLHNDKVTLLTTEDAIRIEAVDRADRLRHLFVQCSQARQADVIEAVLSEIISAAEGDRHTVIIDVDECVSEDYEP